MNILASLTRKLFSHEIERQATQLANTFDVAGYRSISTSPRDRYSYDFAEVLEQSLEAWRVNPLARRIVGLTTQYVVGCGMDFTCKHQPTSKFLKNFWNHSNNLMSIRIHEWCDELTRTGNLILLMSTDASGMSYFRAMPADQVKSITSSPNDIERELSIIFKSTADRDEKEYPIYREESDALTGDGLPITVAFHFSINRPIGAQFGEPDLAPVLRWLSRYANWLEDRARLNRFRTSFLYVVKSKFASKTERLSRQAELNANPPSPGSILVTDESETWDVLSSKLESSEANEDGLALKKMIAAGVGIPLHFLAEPESSTRTTAEAAGGPTYRHFEQRQEFFTNLIQILLRAVIIRRSMFDKKISTKAEVTLQAADISSRDNVSLAMAASNMIGVLKDLRDRKLIDDAELLRLMYRFFGETVDVEQMLQRGRKAADPKLRGESAPINPAPSPSSNSPPIKQEVRIDPDSGEEQTNTS